MKTLRLAILPLLLAALGGCASGPYYYGGTSYRMHNIGGLPILPAHILANVKDWRSWQPANEKNARRPEMSNLVGSGPFVFAGYKPGEYVRFPRNDAFWTRPKP